MKAGRRVFECVSVADAVAVTSLAVSRASGLLYGSVSSGHLFAFNVEERQGAHRWQLRSQRTSLIGCRSPTVSST